MRSEYLQSIIEDLTEVAWEEHGRGIRNRTTLVGVEYFESKYGDELVKGSVEATMDAVIAAMKEEGIICEAEYSRDDLVLRVEFGACGHLQTEKQLMERGVIGVVNCPSGNILMHFLGKCVGKYCELAGVEIKGDRCTVTMVMMQDREA